MNPLLIFIGGVLLGRMMTGESAAQAVQRTIQQGQQMAGFGLVTATPLAGLGYSHRPIRAMLPRGGGAAASIEVIGPSWSEEHPSRWGGYLKN